MVELEKFEEHIWRSLEANLGEKFRRVVVYAMAYWNFPFGNSNKGHILLRRLPANSVSIDYLEKGMDQNILCQFNSSEIEKKVKELSERVKLTRGSKQFLWQATRSIPKKDRNIDLEDSYYDLSFIYLCSPPAVAFIVNVWWVWVPRKYEVIFFQEFIKPRSSEQVYRAKKGAEEWAVLECREFRRIYNDMPRLRVGAFKWKNKVLLARRKDCTGKFQTNPSVVYDCWCCFGENSWKGSGLLSLSDKKLNASRRIDDLYFMLINGGSIISEVSSKISSASSKEGITKEDILKRLRELENDFVSDLGEEGRRE